MSNIALADGVAAEVGLLGSGLCTVVAGIGCRYAVFDEDDVGFWQSHVFHLFDGSIYHGLCHIEVVGAIVAYPEHFLCFVAYSIILLFRNNKETIGLEEFRQVVTAHLACCLIELQIVVGGIDKGVLHACAGVGTKGLEELLIEVRLVTLHVKELIELEVHVSALPDASVLPIDAISHVLECLRDILCTTGQVTILIDGYI